MCDQETKNLFANARRRELFGNIISGIVLLIVSWGAYQIFEQGKSQIREISNREHLEESYEAHVKEFSRLGALIPDGFFTKSRYGTTDAYKDQEHNRIEREANKALIMAEITLLDRRIQYLEKLSTKHISESAIYIQIVKDTAVNVKEMQKILWKVVPDE